MKKIFLLSLVAVFAFSLEAQTKKTKVLASKGRDMTSYHKDSWKFEPTFGPSIGIKNADTRFAMNVKIGKEHWGYQLGMAFGGVPKVLLKPSIVYDYPFYFTFSNSRKNDFSVGPTINLGPVFGFSGATMLDFLTLGFGARTTYQFSNSFGVVAELFNMNMGFVRWIKGVGINKNFVVTYDMKFGIFMLF